VIGIAISRTGRQAPRFRATVRGAPGRTRFLPYPWSIVDINAFFGVVSGIDFTLLGLWWVAVQDRHDLRRAAHKGRMAYAVSLQFIVPGTAGLLGQVAPNVPLVWQIAYALAGASGAVAVLLLAPTLAGAGSARVAALLRWCVAPLYVLITAVAVDPSLVTGASKQLTGLQVEGIFFCLLVFISAQTAWAAAMSPEPPADEAIDAEEPHVHVPLTPSR
jgi:hypothetical protein